MTRAIVDLPSSAGKSPADSEESTPTRRKVTRGQLFIGGHGARRTVASWRRPTPRRSSPSWLNTWHKYHPNAPFGGYKASGYGREQGAEALESYTQYKTVWARLA